MKAAVLHGKEDVRVEDIEPQALKPGEARLRIEAALTCGTDLKVFKRGYHAKMIVPPAVFGHELAGTVSELSDAGDGMPAGQWKPGDRVVVANSAPCGECFHCRAGQENICDDLQFSERRVRGIHCRAGPDRAEEHAAAEAGDGFSRRRAGGAAGLRGARG